MSEGYAIELYFDPSLENQILKTWNVFARRQISSKLINTASRPHITLLSTTTTSSLDSSSKLESIIKTFASKIDPLPLSFSSISTFSNDNNTLFLTPTPSLSLLQFQIQLIDAIKREGIEIGEEYRTDSWIPFCPVAVDVAKSRVAEGINVLREMKLPVNGYAMDIGLIEFFPVREVFSFGFGNNSLDV